jgi:glycosyltransferase involved in cell wall biosynthesis
MTICAAARRPLQGQKTAVSITPIALEADSRTLKIARSLARFGYRSLVIEGIASRNVAQFEMPVWSLAKPAEAPATGIASVRRRLRNGTGIVVADAAIAVAYRARHYWNFGIKVARHLPPADLYYLHGFHHAPAVAMAARLHAATYIYDAHDFYPDMQADAEITAFERRWLNPFLEHVERRCCDRAGAVVTVSDGVAELMARRFCCRPFVLRNAHDGRTDGRPERDVRMAAGVSPDDRLIVLVGNDKPGQATRHAIDALVGLSDQIHLAFVGAGYESHRQRVIELGLETRIHFVGRVLPDIVVPFIATADAAAILYYPHTGDYRYALPNKFFQAIAAGLPLFYSAELEEVQRICRAYGYGIEIDPRDQASLRRAFGRLADEAALFAEQRDAARRAGLAVNWAAEEQRLGEILTMLDRSRRE